MTIAISTLAFLGKSIDEAMRIADENGWILEFSSGIPFRSDLKELYLHAKSKRLIHNYFPPPEIPFVLNLGSSNEEIRKRSVGHCIQGLRLAKTSGAPFYSAHAGFCIDPNPKELGKQLVVQKISDRNANWQFFLQSLKRILQEAEKSETDFLVENNVLASFNVMHGENPLFCCDPVEIEKLFAEIQHPRLALLLDTGHLKVSSRTFGFDLEKAVDEIAPYIRCIHHSDNDGLRDTNEKMSRDYWFIKHMPPFKKIVHVIEVKNLSTDDVKNQILLLKNS